MWSSFLCDFTQRSVVIPYRRLGIIHRSHLQASSSPRRMLNPWRGDRYVVPKRRYTITIIRCVESKKREDLNRKLHTIFVLSSEISLLNYLMKTDMLTYLAFIVLRMTTWKKEIYLYRAISKSYLSHITLSLSLITLLHSTVVTKIWATIWTNIATFSCAYTQILKRDLHNVKCSVSWCIWDTASENTPFFVGAAVLSEVVRQEISHKNLINILVSFLRSKETT